MIIHGIIHLVAIQRIFGSRVGLMNLHTVGLSLLGLPVMWFGTQLGELAFRSGSDAMHRQVSIVSLGVIALVSAVKGIGELT